MRLTSLRGLGECIKVPNSSPVRYVDINTGVPCDPNKPTAVGPIYQGSAPVGQEGAGRLVDTPVGGFEGTITVPGVESRLAQDLYARTSSRYQLEHGMAATPAEIGSILQASADQYCSFYPGACIGVDVPGIIRKFVGEYTGWYNSNLSEYHSKVDAGTINATPGAPPPPSGYVPPSSATSGPLWQQQQENALKPGPSKTSVDTSKNAQFTGSDNLNAGAGGNDSDKDEKTDASKWLEENWVLLAAGAAALLLIPMMGKR